MNPKNKVLSFSLAKNFWYKPLISVTVFGILSSLQNLDLFFIHGYSILIFYTVGPGVIFGILYPQFKDFPIWKKVVFVLQSSVINVIAYFIAMIGAYWGPVPYMVYIGSATGAILVLLAYSLLYQKLPALTISHLVSGLVIASISALFLYQSNSFVMYLLGILIWHGGIGLILLTINPPGKPVEK